MLSFIPYRVPLTAENVCVAKPRGTCHSFIRLQFLFSLNFAYISFTPTPDTVLGLIPTLVALLLVLGSCEACKTQVSNEVTFENLICFRYSIKKNYMTKTNS